MSDPGRRTPLALRFGPDILRDADAARDKEWLVTNGIGGFASSSVIGLNTRRYHGLLVASLHPPVQRRVLVSSLDETVIFGERSFELGVHQYPGVIHPQGHAFLTSFELTWHPLFSYEVGGARLTKAIWMERGRNTTFIRYAWHGKESLRMRLRPMLNDRDYHGLQRASDDPDRYLIRQEEFHLGVLASPDAVPYFVAWSQGSFHPESDWYYRTEYALERERGLDFQEDLFSPGFIETDLSAGAPLFLRLSTDAPLAPPELAGEASLSLVTLVKRKEELLALQARALSPERARLVLAADEYIVKRESTRSETVIAGYPWFTDWGRDAMIALPGLALATGRYDESKAVLRNFTSFIDRGMVPNLFPDGGQPPEFNSADGTLWFVVALHKYFEKTGDLAFLEEMSPRLDEIAAEHLKGTRFGIRVDADGLLAAGGPGTQLTWMDAKVGDKVITPRFGKPVEVNALWINVLFILERFTSRLKKAPSLPLDPRRTRREFVRQFWNPEAKCLYDVVGGPNKDASIRPNQIFAAALPFPLLSRTRARHMLASVKKRLLTPLGLRTLDRNHPNYRPRYHGGPVERDSAYHQGTAWPWLIGPYLQAYAYAYGKPPLTGRVLRHHIAPLFRHLSEAGLGHISEVVDGDPPHAPGGCFAQAWSVGTLLEALDTFEPGTRS